MIEARGLKEEEARSFFRGQQSLAREMSSLQELRDMVETRDTLISLVKSIGLKGAEALSFIK